MSTIAIITLALALVFVFTSCRGRRYSQRHDARMERYLTRKLDLDTDQAAKVKRIMSNIRLDKDKMDVIKKEIKLSFEQNLTSPNFDDSAVNKLAEQKETEISALRISVVSSMKELNSVLNTNQKAKLQKLLERHNNSRRGRRHEHHH